jgi:hypothetical protein
VFFLKEYRTLRENLDSTLGLHVIFSLCLSTEYRTLRENLESNTCLSCDVLVYSLYREYRTLRRIWTNLDCEDSCSVCSTLSQSIGL